MRQPGHLRAGQLTYARQCRYGALENYDILPPRVVVGAIKVGEEKAPRCADALHTNGEYVSVYLRSARVVRKMSKLGSVEELAYSTYLARVNTS